MSHGITQHDQMFGVRAMPWHGLGVVLDQYPRSIDEALERAGLGWNVNHGDVLVVKTPEWTDDFGIKHPPQLIPAKGYKANLREDTGEWVWPLTASRTSLSRITSPRRSGSRNATDSDTGVVDQIGG
jgi:hypothetical protein